MPSVYRTRSVSALALVLLAAAACSPRNTEEYKKKVEGARAQHEAEFRRDYVGLAGLEFLNEGSNPAGSDKSNTVVLPASVPASIGAFVLKEKQVTFEPAAFVPVALKGQTLTEPTTLLSDGDAAARSTPGMPAVQPDELTIGSVTFWVHNSGDRRAIRVRDEQGEVARTFTGFKWFPIDEKWRVVGTFIPEGEARTVQVPNLKGDFATYKTEGLVEFKLEGQTIRMRPMTTKPGRLFFIMRDATAGTETYAAARFLYADLLPDNTVVLDFNEAHNPPCAFNPYTTCPLPPAENRLTLAVRAGEKDYDGPTRHKVDVPR